LNPKAILIVPAYNEETRLQPESFLTFLNEQDQVDLYFINDGSTDGTQGLIEQLIEQAPQGRAFCHHLTQNVGKAEAVRLGLQKTTSMETSYTYVGYWDADLATPLEASLTLLNALATTTFQVAIGSRVMLSGWNIERRMTRHYLGRIFCTFIDSTFRLGIYDTQCGAKLFRSEAVWPHIQRKFCSTWIFDVELLIRLRQNQKDKALFYESPLPQWRDIEASKVKPSAYLGAARDYLKLIWTYLIRKS
jgi:glycosyltransferase involved in cell wall biosynthesis